MIEITSNLAPELKQKYQEIEQLQNHKDLIKKTKLEINLLKQIKQDKITKLCDKIKDADSNKTNKKKYDSVLKEIREYDLTKYLPEITQAIIECMLHQSNIKFFVELCIILNNYEEFSTQLLQATKKQLKTLMDKGGNFENEDKRAQKRKNLLRLFGELHQVIIQNEQFADILRLILPNDQPPEYIFANISVITNFMLHFGYDYFGYHRTEVRKDLLENPDLQNIFKDKKHNNTIEQIIRDHIQYIEKVLLETHQKITESQIIKNDSQGQKQKDQLNQLQENQQKLKDSYKIIIDCLGELNTQNPKENNKILYLLEQEVNVSGDDSDCFFDDEKRLYCDLIKIVNQPEINQQVNQQITQQKQKDCSSIEIADQMALDFVNTKGNRKKLIDEIQNFKQNYLVLLPYQCRLLGTLCRNYKEFEEEVTKSFIDQYKLIKSNDHPDRKSRFLRYICELTKFKVLKQDIILDIFSSFLEDLISQNVELIVLILENCGRFLKYSNESSKKFEFLLTQLDKQRKLKPLGQQQENLFIKALLSFDRQAKQKKEKTQLQKFIKYIIFDQLDDFNEAFNSMEMLPLNDQNCAQYFIKQLLKISVKGRYSTQSIIACLLAALKEKYSWITGQIVDSLLEEIMCGLEDNSMNKRQRRITITKMIGELYAYHIVDKDLIFKLLYQIIEFGHDSDIPQSEQDIVDPPDDSFRINQVISLVESLREYYKQLKPELIKFLVQFQRYILSKKYLPQIVEFAVLDLYENVDNRLAKLKGIKQVEQVLNSNNIEEALTNLPDGSSQLVGIDKKQIEDQKEMEQQRKLEQELDQQYQQQIKDSQNQLIPKKPINQNNNKKNQVVIKGTGEIKVVTKFEVVNTKDQKRNQIPNAYLGWQ